MERVYVLWLKFANRLVTLYNMAYQVTRVGVVNVSVFWGKWSRVAVWGL